LVHQISPRDLTTGDLVHQISSRDLATGDLVHQIGSRDLATGDLVHQIGPRDLATGDLVHQIGSRDLATGDLVHQIGSRDLATDASIRIGLKPDAPYGALIPSGWRRSTLRLYQQWIIVHCQFSLVHCLEETKKARPASSVMGYIPRQMKPAGPDGRCGLKPAPLL